MQLKPGDKVCWYGLDPLYKDGVAQEIKSNNPSTYPFTVEWYRGSQLKLVELSSILWVGKLRLENYFRLISTPKAEDYL